jgi:hypothetical protein
MNRCRCVSLCILLCSVLLAGCAKKSNRSTVTGNVMLDGQPLKTGIIRFVPADGQTSTADGRIDDGKFSVNVPPGDKRVSISSQKVIGKRKAQDMPESPMIDIVEEILPAKYNVQSDLTLKVDAGSQEKNFDLKSGK